MKHLRSTPAALRCSLSLLLLAVSGCGDDDASSTPDASVDASSTADASVDASRTPDANDVCERAEAAFVAYVVAHQNCERDSDCTIVGDCGPNADFTAISVGAEAEGMRLMTARCGGAYDGVVPSAVCNAGVCAENYDEPWGCCGCQEPDDAGDIDSGNADSGF